MRSMAEGRRIPAHPDDVREGLREAAARLNDARRAQQDALHDVQAWLIAANEISTGGDLTFSEAIELSGVSRRTAYQMIAESES